MENVIFLYQKNILEISMESRPHEDFGYDYDKHDDYIELGDGALTDVGLVDIETLINNLTQMRSHGATHVGCDWHCDHGELDLYGVEYRLAKQDEIEAYHNAKKLKEDAKKQREIETLEAKLKTLKNE